MDRKDPAIFRSVRNIFLFGRGGTRNLKCIYKFEGMRGERVRIKLRKVTTMNRQCMSRVDEDINRSFCYGDTSVKVEVSTKKAQHETDRWRCHPFKHTFHACIHGGVNGWRVDGGVVDGLMTARMNCYAK